MFRAPGTTHYVENEHVVVKYRRFLPAEDGGRKESLIQFYAREGGHRTVSESSVIAIR